MGNAVESIYKLAKYHTTTCDNNGIEDFLGKQFKFK
jgi:hydroxymethylpyrimidine pyrophosphatase-like HAD family hydrolase